MGSAVLALAMGWSTGIAAGSVLAVPGVVGMIAGAAVVAAALLAPATGLRLLAVGLAAFLLGTVRADAGRETVIADPLEAYVGDVVLLGRVVEAPLPRGSRVEAVVEVDAVAGPGALAPSSLTTNPRPRVLLRAVTVRATAGDRIETRGRLSRPRSRPGWPLEEMLARRQIRWVMDAGGARVVEPAGTSVVSVLTAARGVFEANTRAILPEPHASLVAGIVFGARVGLPPELRQAMSATGTSHLTAVSGANVAMVAGTLMLAASGLVSRLPASVVTIAGVWLYTLLVGAPPSALRAATMATFALAASGVGRQADAVVGLALAVAVLLTWDPGLALDLGFQLSATATAGLILLAPPIEARLGRLPGWLRGHVAVAVAAQIATLPLIVGTFQRLSLVSLPANVLAAPMISPIMASGALIAVFGVVPGLNTVLGWTAWLFTSVLLAVIETAAQLPGGVVAVGRMPFWVPLGWYLVLGCWVAAGSADVRALGVRPGTLKVSAFGGAVLMGLFALTGWPDSRDDDGVQVVLLDTDPASAFVRTPGGQSALLTTATASRGIAASVGTHLNVAERAVDVEVGPGTVRTGVDLLEIGSPAASGDSDRSDLEEGDPEAIDRSRSGRAEVGTGARVELGDGVVVAVVDIRLVGERRVTDLAVLVGDVVVLLPGPGTPSAYWSDLAPDAATVAALPSNAVTWARALPARNWLLLVGELPPSPARRQVGAPLLTRRQHGAIELMIRGSTVSVVAERCLGGHDCAVDLPPPMVRTVLLDGEPDGENGSARPPVQSGQLSDGP